MKKSFDDILRECIAELEGSGGDIRAVLRRYPERADELRPHLEVWASLSAVEKAEATAEGAERGRQRLLTAVGAAEQKRERSEVIVNRLFSSGGFALKTLGAFAVVAALGLGITFLTGNLDVGFGDQAEAGHTNPCLDTVLGDLADPPDGHFDVDDLLAFRQAFQDQNTDPRYDRDGDGDVDIDDVMVYIQELNACFGPGPVP